MILESNIQDALADLKGLLAKRTSVERAMQIAASENDIPLQTLFVRAERAFGDLHTLGEHERRAAINSAVQPRIERVAREVLSRDGKSPSKADVDQFVTSYNRARRKKDDR